MTRGGFELRLLAAAALTVLAGCASQTVEFYRLPPETPAADNRADVAKVQALAAAAALAREQRAQAASADAADEAPPPVTPRSTTGRSWFSATYAALRSASRSCASGEG